MNTRSSGDSETEDANDSTSSAAVTVIRKTAARCSPLALEGFKERESALFSATAEFLFQYTTDQVQPDGSTLTTPYIWVQCFHLFEPLFVCGLKSSQSTPSPSSSSSFHRSCGFRELSSHVGYFLPSVLEVLTFLCMAAVRPPGHCPLCRWCLSASVCSSFGLFECDFGCLMPVESCCGCLSFLFLVLLHFF